LTAVTREQPMQGKKQRYHHGDLRAALVGAALALIDEHGVKGFALKDAAKAAGVSTAAPYRHFVDKEALLQAIEDEGFALFNAALAAAYAGKERLDQRIVEMGVAYVRFALEHPAHFRVMFGAGTGKYTGPAGENARGFLLLVDAVTALHPDAPEEMRGDLVLTAWSVVHGFALLQLDGAFAATVGMTDPEAQLRRMLGVMIGTAEA
jgi:AcrR family transcriptional regulator